MSESSNNLKAEFASIQESFMETGQLQMATFVMTVILKNMEVLKEEEKQNHFSNESIVLANKSLEQIAKAVRERVEEINKSIH